MKAVYVAAVCVTLALVSLAQAQQGSREQGLKKGSYAPTIEAKRWLNTQNNEPVSLAELRGMTVCVFFWVSWHEGGEFVMPLMNLLNSRIGRTQGMYIMGVTDSDEGRVRKMLEKEKVYFPIALESKAYEEYKISAFPQVVVIDAYGKVQWTGWPGPGGDALWKAAQDIIAETPPFKTHPEEAVIADESLRKARQAMREGNLEAAIKATIEAGRHALRGDALSTRCQDVGDLVEALGRDILAQADQAAEDRNFEEAVSLLQSIRRDFRDTSVDRSARRHLEALKNRYEEVASILSRGDETNKAERLLSEAIASLRANPRKIGEAYDKLEEIVKDYPDSPAATKAKTVMERMGQNSAVMDYVRDHKASAKCETLLSQARAYMHSGESAKARDLLRRTMEECADTVYADEATKLLKQIP